MADCEARVQALDLRVDADGQLTRAESHAWRKWAGHLPEQVGVASKRKKKKRKRRKNLPKTSSSRLPRAAHTWKPGHNFHGRCMVRTVDTCSYVSLGGFWAISCLST